MFKLVSRGIVSFFILSSLGCAGVQQTMDDIGKGVSQGIDQATGGKGFVGAVSDGVKDDLNGKVPQVLGYINLGNGGYITYFDNNKMGFPSQGSILTAPPKAGTVPPPMVVAPTGKFEGKLLPNNIDKMKKEGLFVPVGNSNNTSAGNSSSVKAIVPVFETTDSDGNIIKNAPDNCKTIRVYNKDGTLLKERYLSRPEDFALASKCDTALYYQNMKKIKPATKTN
jgi:hypothetical protein